MSTNAHMMLTQLISLFHLADQAVGQSDYSDEFSRYHKNVVTPHGLMDKELRRQAKINKFLSIPVESESRTSSALEEEGGGEGGSSKTQGKFKDKLTESQLHSDDPFSFLGVQILN